MAFDRNAEADQAYGHKPVLLDECLEALAIRPDGVYLDGTAAADGSGASPDSPVRTFEKAMAILSKSGGAIPAKIILCGPVTVSGTETWSSPLDETVEVTRWDDSALTLNQFVTVADGGSLTLEKLEAMTAVCSVGIDMVVIPGDTTAEVISGLIADEAAIGMVNSKTTAVRIIPVEGKDVGDMVGLGGLLGSAPVMPVHEAASTDFIARGGRIPAPLQSLKN